MESDASFSPLAGCSLQCCAGGRQQGGAELPDTSQAPRWHRELTVHPTSPGSVPVWATELSCSHPGAEVPDPERPWCSAVASAPPGTAEGRSEVALQSNCKRIWILNRSFDVYVEWERLFLCSYQHLVLFCDARNVFIILQADEYLQ